jgi:hypothetical protein
MGLPTFNKPVLRDCVGLDLCDRRRLLGGLRDEERTVFKHGVGYVQEMVGHTA